ncbi:MAG TPA: hypothetical protein VF035_08855 [Longimicrobiales bacterium]
MTEAATQFPNRTYWKVMLTIWILIILAYVGSWVGFGYEDDDWRHLCVPVGSAFLTLAFLDRRRRILWLTIAWVGILVGTVTVVTHLAGRH